MEGRGILSAGRELFWVVVFRRGMGVLVGENKVVSHLLGG